MPSDTELKSVGHRVPRVDGPEIVTGRAVYADDVRLPDMLYGRVLHCPHAHARIREVDTTRARKLPGVVDVIAADDLPGLDLFAKDEACYQGQKVAAVAAEDPDVAEDALKLIEVDYELLPSVTDPKAAIRHDAPPVQLGDKGADVRDEKGRLRRNVVSHPEIDEGDVAKGFAEADAIVEAEFITPFWHQTYIEPNAATARVEADGKISIWTSCQGAFNMRDSVAGTLKIPHAKVRIVPTKVGGGFGAKNGAFVEPHAALLAMRTGRPVRVTMSREEEFLDGRPASGVVIRLKMGGKKDGTITALEGRGIYDGGHRGGGGNIARLRGLYRIENVKLEGLGVRTNKMGPGAYRAPGAPQAAYARESIVDMLARELGWDPLEFRLHNAVQEGDRSISEAPLPKVCLKEMIQQTAAAARWGKTRLKRNQGRGVACGEWAHGVGPSNAFVTVREDGSVSVLTGQVDITGLHTSLAQIVAEEVGVHASRVTVTQADTDMVPYTALSAGSLATYSAGTAAREAGKRARQRILKLAAEFLEVSESDLELADGQVAAVGAPDKKVALSVLAATANGSGEGPIGGQSVSGSIPNNTCFSINIATVEVDPDTGQVKLIDLVAGQDVGKAINPDLVEGQMQGAAVQAAGFGLTEGYQYDDEGRVLNPNLLDYALPTFVDVPNIKTVLVEEPSPHGPYGAKGVGEPPIIPGAAAIANAIQDAVGARVTQTPMTPERVLAALKTKKGE